MRMINQQGQRPGNIPSVLDVTGQQIINARMVIEAVAPFLLVETQERKLGIGGQKDPGPEVVDSATTTFMKACVVLDKILDDTPRWISERYAGLEKALEEVYRKHAVLADSQRQLNEVQAQATATVSRPSLLLKPTIQRKKNGKWVVVHGALRGEGNTVAEAALAFDAAYFGLMVETGIDQSQETNGS